MNLGGGEIFVILLVVLIFFGAKRIPEGMREFKDAMNGVENEVRNAANNNTPPPPVEKKNLDKE
jgi:sec-independent protein translocase protein TatA